MKMTKVDTPDCVHCPLRPVKQTSLQKVEDVENLNPEIAKGFMLVQEWLKHYLETEARKDYFFRSNIVMQKLGQIAKMVIKREVVPDSPGCGSKVEMENAVSALILNSILLAEILHVDLFSAIPRHLLSLQDKEYKKEEKK